MKKIIKAFTFIEILFVITIISFLSVSAVTYFHNFTNTKKMDSDLYMLKDNIDLLDSKVKNKEVYDYELSFTWGNLHYLYKLNSFVNPSKTIFNFDENTKDFSMKSILGYTWSWDVKVYFWEKLLYKKTLHLTDTLTWKLDLYNTYDIKSISDNYEDIFWVYYFSEDNLNSDGITTDFVWANTKDDKTWSGTTSFVLKNINNKLKFYSGSLEWNTNEVYLFFEKAWVWKSLKISLE